MRKIRGMRWYMIGLVTLGTILCYLTRNTIAAAAPTLQTEMHISTQQYSYIIAAFSACYTIAQPITGFIVDTLGTKIGYGIFAMLWGCFAITASFATGWVGLAAARGLGGFAESAMIPSGLKASTEWFPSKERSVAVGYFNVGSSIGAVLAPPIVVWAIMYQSWRLAFVIVGLMTLVWVGLWAFVYFHPSKQKHLSEEEYAYISAGQPNTLKKEKVRVWVLLSQKKFWGIALPRFLAEPAWGTFNAWIPLFMVKTYGFDLKQIAIFAWMPMVFADVGCILGGYMPVFFQKVFRVNLISSRKLVVLLGAFLMIGPGLIGLFGSPYIAIALLCVGGFAHQSLSGALITLSADVFEPHEVATANGLTGMAAWTASTMFALVVGALSDVIGFSPLFAILSVFDILGAIVLFSLLKNNTVVCGASQQADVVDTELLVPEGNA
ncbi:MFS transporter [Celerinatantimonas yamalensis]|uniref:MFS transporter n=1 Tax=Celerinatantimonas yamalensis TaxID=559956 RepID=A0ABW9G5B2_9GAMM